MAAAGLVALDEGRERLPEDHDRARRLGDALGDIAPGSVDPGQVATNMVFVDTGTVGVAPADAIARLAALGVGAVPVSGCGPVRDPRGRGRCRARLRDRRVAVRPERGDVMGLFSKEYPPEVAARVPPGNRLVKSWPVLHYGPIPQVRRRRPGTWTSAAPWRTRSASRTRNSGPCRR